MPAALAVPGWTGRRWPSGVVCAALAVPGLVWAALAVPVPAAGRDGARAVAAAGLTLAAAVAAAASAAARATASAARRPRPAGVFLTNVRPVMAYSSGFPGWVDGGQGRSDRRPWRTGQTAAAE